MPNRRVRSHVRNGRRVRSYSQGYTRGDAQAAAAGAAVDLILALGAVFQVITALLAVLTGILLSLATLLGGTSKGRKSTRSAFLKTRATYRKRRRAHRPPAQQRGDRSSAPWRGTAPWANDRTGVWQRHDGKWAKKVG